MGGLFRVYGVFVAVRVVTGDEEGFGVTVADGDGGAEGDAAGFVAVACEVAVSVAA